MRGIRVTKFHGPEISSPAFAKHNVHRFSVSRSLLNPELNANVSDNGSCYQCIYWH